MIATIAVIAAIAEKKKFSDHMETMHFPAIAATTITEIELFISQRLLLLRSLEIGFHMIAELFLSAITAMVEIIWKLGFNII